MSKVAFAESHTIIRDAKGAPEYVVVPYGEYESLWRAHTAGEDHSEDAELIRIATPHRGEEKFPAAVANLIIDGEAPLKVIREWRNLTQAQLAKKANVAAQYISQIERGDDDRKLGRKSAEKLAKVLDVSAGILMDL